MLKKVSHPSSIIFLFLDASSTLFSVINGLVAIICASQLAVYSLDKIDEDVLVGLTTKLNTSKLVMSANNEMSLTYVIVY